MNIAKNALRSFFSSKTQAVLSVLLIIIGVFVYTCFTQTSNVTYESVVSYDAAQNTEDYGFIPRLKLTDEQWDNIFEEYNIPGQDQTALKNNMLDGNVLIQQYNVNLYDYQKDFIEQVEAQHDVTVETSFNKMLADEMTGHQYRIFADSGSIDQPYVIEGSLPSAANEVTILPEYAKYNDLGVGDTLELNGVNYTISGLVYHPAYITPIVTSNVVKESSVYYPETQSILFMTEDALAEIDGLASFAYKSKANQVLTSGEKNALYHRLYDSNDFEILENGLDSITHGETYRRANIITGIVIVLSIIICGSCMYVVSQIIKRRIDADKRQIGTLKSLGYKSWEIARSYCSFAVIISILGSTIGWILGHLAYQPFISVLYKDYNFPINFFTNYSTLIYAFAVPLIVMVGVSMINALLMLNKPPLDLVNDNSDSSINALGKFVTRVLRKAAFETRVKYQMACRSVSKLFGMLSISLVAGILLLIGIIMSSALAGMSDKTFSGFNVENIVTFHATSNINDTQPQYEDEEPGLGKDMFIQEVRYQNGKVTVYDDTNKIKTEVVGMSPDSAYVNLVNENGESLNNVLADGLVINKVVEGKYGVTVGDRLLLNSTHENIEVEIEIVGIADQYSGYIVYAETENLNRIFGYPTGTYNAVFTNHQYQLSDSRVYKILAIEDFKDGLGANLRTFEVIFQVITVLAVVIAFVLILISANLIIEENSKNISTFKVLGYSSGEISNLVVNTYTPLMFIGYILAIPISTLLMEALGTVLAKNFDLPITVSIGAVNGLLGFAVLMITYFVGLRFSRRNIDKVELAESLKYAT